MKILVVSSWPDNEMMYPHLRTVIKNLSKDNEVEYFLFRERGYSFVEKLSLKTSFKLWIKIIKDVYKLKKKYNEKQFDKILLIDHFTYVCASFILPKEKLIFWSFDIMGDDSTYYKFRFIRFILFLNSLLLKKSGKLIIQCKERLELLERTLKLKIPAENVCYLPVYIEKADKEISHTLHAELPVLMQCSSFDGQRYTDELLVQYQQDTNYILYLQGLHLATFENKLKKLAKKPTYSVELVPPSEVYNIVDKADIGFLGLKLKEDNCKYLYNASGQLLEFLRRGKPVVSFGENNVGKVLEENNAGIEIFDLKELSNAVSKIKANYQFYSKNAYALFLKDYDSVKIMQRLSNFLEAGTKCTM